MNGKKPTISKSAVIGLHSRKDDLDINQFFKRLAESELGSDFDAYRLSIDAMRGDIKKHIIEHGLSSLFYSHITCDSIMHPGITIDEIEAIVLGVMGSLEGVKHLLIIDPYFYDDNPDCLVLLEKIIRSMCSSLIKVTIITNGARKNKRPFVHAVFNSVVPGMQIADAESDDFHDRFWIDVDQGKGIVVGTSLNGIGKKIAMIDHANPADMRELITLASPYL